MRLHLPILLGTVSQTCRLTWKSTWDKWLACRCFSWVQHLIKKKASDSWMEKEDHCDRKMIEMPQTPRLIEHKILQNEHHWVSKHLESRMHRVWECRKSQPALAQEMRSIYDSYFTTLGNGRRSQFKREHVSREGPEAWSRRKWGQNHQEDA